MSLRHTAYAAFPLSSTLAGGLFPAKLHDMIEFADQAGLASSTIAWTANGFAFVVLDPDKLVESLLGVFFEQTKYRSFLRQLAMWSFERTNVAGNGLPTFRHPYFSRGQKHAFESLSREVFRTSTIALATTRSQSLGAGAIRLRRSKSNESTGSDGKVKPKFAASNQDPMTGSPPSKNSDSNQVASKPIECASFVSSAGAAAVQSPMVDAGNTSNFDNTLHRALFLHGGSISEPMSTIHPTNVSPTPFRAFACLGETAASASSGIRNLSNHQLVDMPFFAKLSSPSVEMGKESAIYELHRRSTVDTGSLARALLQNEQTNDTQEADKTTDAEKARLEFAGKTFYSLDA
jgi:hypothetical protein